MVRPDVVDSDGPMGKQGEDETVVEMQMAFEADRPGWCRAGRVGHVEDREKMVRW